MQHGGITFELVILQQILELVPDGLDVLLDENAVALADEVGLAARVQVGAHTLHLLCQTGLDLGKKRRLSDGILRRGWCGCTFFM